MPLDLYRIGQRPAITPTPVPPVATQPPMAPPGMMGAFFNNHTSSTATHFNRDARRDERMARRDEHKAARAARIAARRPGDAE